MFTDVHTPKWQKMYTLKLTEKKRTAVKMVKNTYTRNWQKCTPRVLQNPKWNKNTYWKMADNAQPENNRIENSIIKYVRKYKC